MLVHVCFFPEFPSDVIAENNPVQRIFSLLLCSDFTSHVSVSMKIRFKDSAAPDKSTKV